MAMGTMGGGIAGGLNSIKHDSWAGAIWGGTKQAAENVAIRAKAAVTGEFEYKGFDGQEHQFKTNRLDALKGIAGGVECAYRAHTFSMRDPEGFKRAQQSILQFQGGGH